MSTSNGAKQKKRLRRPVAKRSGKTGPRNRPEFRNGSVVGVKKIPKRGKF